MRVATIVAWGNPFRFQAPLTLHQPTHLAYDMQNLNPHVAITWDHFLYTQANSPSKGANSKVLDPSL